MTTESNESTFFFATGGKSRSSRESKDARGGREAGSGPTTPTFHVLSSWSRSPSLDLPPERASSLVCDLTVADGADLWTAKVYLAKLLANKSPDIAAGLYIRLALCALTGRDDPLGTHEPLLAFEPGEGSLKVIFVFSPAKGDRLKVLLHESGYSVPLRYISPATSEGTTAWKTLLQFFLEDRSSLKSSIADKDKRIKAAAEEKSRLELVLAETEYNREDEETSAYLQFVDVLNAKKRKIRKLQRLIQKMNTSVGISSSEVGNEGPEQSPERVLSPGRARTFEENDDGEPGSEGVRRTIRDVISPTCDADSERGMPSTEHQNTAPIDPSPRAATTDAEVDYRSTQAAAADSAPQSMLAETTASLEPNFRMERAPKIKRRTRGGPQ